MQTDNTSQPPVNSHQSPELPTLEELRASEQRYLARKRGEHAPKPLTETARAYIQRMQAAEREAGDTSITALMSHVGRRVYKRPFIPYPYTCDEAYPLALTIYRSRLAAIGRQLVWESD